MATYSDPALILPGVIGEDELAVEVVSDINNIRTNVALVAFKSAVNGSLVRFNLQNGVIDDFQDENGILSSLSFTYSSDKYVCSLQSVVSEDGHLSNFSVSGGYPYSQGYDGNLSTFWDLFDEEEQLDKYFYYHLTSAAIVTSIKTKMSLASDRSIEVYGSNNGTEWTLEDTITFLASGAGVLTEYTINNTNSYSYYKFVIKSAGVNIINLINEIEFHGLGVLISETSEAESQPTNIHAVILADDAAITLNTDLKCYASVDDGGTSQERGR